jgi:hypothetical protein
MQGFRACSLPSGRAQGSPDMPAVALGCLRFRAGSDASNFQESPPRPPGSHAGQGRLRRGDRTCTRPAVRPSAFRARLDSSASRQRDLGTCVPGRARTDRVTKAARDGAPVAALTTEWQGSDGEIARDNAMATDRQRTRNCAPLHTRMILRAGQSRRFLRARQALSRHIRRVAMRFILRCIANE